MKRSVADNRLTLPQRGINGVLLTALLLLMVIPMLNVLALSFSTRMGSMRPGIHLWPDAFSTEGYRTIWMRTRLWQPFLNSFYVSTVGMLLTITLSSMAGYVLIQHDLPLKEYMAGIILLTMMIPGDLTIISIYALNKSLHLLNRYTGLILNGLVSGFSILLMRNYFLSVPESLAESARIDSAGEMCVFFRIYLPLSIPGLAALSFLEFVGKWNSLMIPVTIISEQRLFTLPMILKTLVFNTDSTSGTDYIAPNAVMAAIVISVLPLIVAYLFMQNNLIGGITLGATKE